MRTPNATFDVYLNGALATTGAAGHIRPHFALGGEVSEGNTAFRWTHILEVALGTDIRDQWPATPTGAHFILLPTDSELDEGECAERYNVVEVERIRDQRGAEFKRVYLNRECQGVAIRVKEVDGNPDYAGICEIQFDQADGFVLSQPSAGKVRVDLTAAGITVEDDDSNPTYSSVTILQFDQDDGFSISQPAAGKAKIDFALPSSGLPTDNPGGSFSGKSVPYWIKVSKSHTDFQTAGTSKSVTAWTAQAKAFLHAVVVHVSTTFAGSGFASYMISAFYETSPMGISINALSGNGAHEVLGASNAASSAWPSGTVLGVGSMTASKDVKIQADSFGANLSASTAGVVDIYLLVSQLP